MGTILRWVSMVMLIKLWVGVLNVGAAVWSSTEMNPSIMVLGIWDYELWLYDKRHLTSRCMQMVNRVTQFGGSRVNFVVTHYWKDLQAVNDIDYFCSMDSDLKCNPFDQVLVDKLRVGMHLCFQMAVDAGLSIAIVPHLDDASPKASWRNGLLFDPLVKHGNFSYYDVMLEPLGQALSATVFRPDTKVWFALSGEMSATVMRYPDSYRQIIPVLRSMVMQGKEGIRQASRIKVGISLNFNKLDAVNTPETVPIGVPPLNASALNLLFAASDFIGISAYKPLKENFLVKDLQLAAWEFHDNLKRISPSLTQYVEPDSGKELHYSEFGLGGGASVTGDVPARNAAEAAHYPFYGIQGNYNVSTDPWQTPTVRQFLRKFYDRAARFFATGGGPDFHISACFLWNLASWDVIAIYPESTIAGEGSYLDEVVARRILLHNNAITLFIPVEVNTILPIERFPDLGPLDVRIPEELAAVVTPFDKVTAAGGSQAGRKLRAVL